jgi:hypothetical protein
VLYVEVPLLSDMTQSHVVSANAAVAMTPGGVIDLTYRASKKRFLAWDSLTVVIVHRTPCRSRIL